MINLPCLLQPAATKKYGKHVSKCIKVLDMTGLKLSALNQIKLMTIISSIDDLNYPEKTQTYYIVNAPYVFSACWKVCPKFLSHWSYLSTFPHCKNGISSLIFHIFNLILFF